MIKNDNSTYANGTCKKTEVNEENIVAWEANDNKDRADIILAVCPSELSHIKDTTLAEVWKKLSNVYESKGPARKATSFKQLLFAKLSENGSMSDHLNKFFIIVDKLKNMDIVIANDLLSILLLYSIPSNYKNFRCAIEARDDLPTPEALKIKLLEEERAKKEFETTTNDSHAHFARHNWNQNANKQKYDIDQNTPGNYKKHRPFYCNYCHKPNHKAADCWQKANRKQQSTSLIQEEGAYLSSSNKNNFINNPWCVDSGATSHMCHDINLFKNFKYTENQKVTLANNNTTNIRGKGTVNFILRNEDKNISKINL